MSNKPATTQSRKPTNLEWSELPRFEEHVSDVASKSPMRHVIGSFVGNLREKMGMTVNKSVVGYLVFYLEDIGASKVEVMNMIKAFPKSDEMRACIRYDRTPTVRDFLDVFDRANGRATDTRVGDSNPHTP